MTRKNKVSLLPTKQIIATEQSAIIQGIVKITAPTMQWEEGYVRRKLDVALNSAQATQLKSIQLGLEKAEAQLASGRYVANPVDAIRWLLENCKEVSEIRNRETH